MHFEMEQLYTDNTKALAVVMGRKEAKVWEGMSNPYLIREEIQIPIFEKKAFLSLKMLNVKQIKK